MSSKNRVTVNLSEEEHADVFSMAGNFNVSVAWIGRQAIREFLQKYRDASKDLPLPLKVEAGE